MLHYFVSLAVLVVGVLSQCDKTILPDLTYRLGGNNLEWPCQSTKNIYTSTGRYTPKNIIATRAQIFNDEAYLVLPRYKSGVPFTLGRINLRKGGCQTAITPYPCWALQEEGNCQALQSVVDLFIDGQVCHCPDIQRAIPGLLKLSFISGYFVGIGCWYCQYFTTTR